MMTAITKGKFVNNKTLKEGWTYVSVSDGTVIGITVSVTKVTKLEDAIGKPLLNPDGTPAYYILTSNILKTLTRSEWEEVKKDGVIE